MSELTSATVTAVQGLASPLTFLFGLSVCLAVVSFALRKLVSGIAAARKF